MPLAVATTPTGGSVTFIYDERYAEHEDLAHEAWRQMWKESPRMMKRLVDAVGVDYAHEQFCAKLQIRRL